MSQNNLQTAEGNVEMFALSKQANKEYIKSVFDAYDEDGDGKITHQELTDMIREESYRYSLEVDVIQHVFQAADEDANSVITFTEFKKMIDNPTLAQYFIKATDMYMCFIMPPSHKRTKKGARCKVEREICGGGIYEEFYSCSPPKLGLILISFVITILFILDEIKFSSSNEGFVGQYLSFNPSKKKEVWRYLTYMFVHDGYDHVIPNVIFQLLIGIPLEMVHGTRRVLTVYLAGVLLGSLANCITDPFVTLVGASGGAYSIVSAHIAAVIMNWREMRYATFQLLIFLIIIVSDLANTIYLRYELKQDRISCTAHLAGAVTGLLFGINILRNIEMTRKENIFKWCSSICFFILTIVCIVLNIWKK